MQFCITSRLICFCSSCDVYNKVSYTFDKNSLYTHFASFSCITISAGSLEQVMVPSVYIYIGIQQIPAFVYPSICSISQRRLLRPTLREYLTNWHVSSTFCCSVKFTNKYCGIMATIIMLKSTCQTVTHIETESDTGWLPDWLIMQCKLDLNLQGF